MIRRISPIVILIIASALMFLMPSPRLLDGASGATELAKVVKVDDSGIELLGVVEYGYQSLEVEFSDGSRKVANNTLRGQMELDKKFKVGDTVQVVLGEEPLIARDHWRLGWAMVLFGMFSLLLAIFGGWTGLKALLSFVFSCVAIWKLLIPLCLRGYSPIWISFITVMFLTAVIMYLVAGWTKKAYAAFLGAMLGIVVSLACAGFFSSVMHVNGATMPYVQTLVNSGFANLSIFDVFIGAIILASSGAVMDLAMDISAGVAEVRLHNPSLGFGELVRSGLRMGRSVVGTMTTTLLLAYSGGYLTLLMVFAAQGTSPIDFLNSTLVSAELVKTLVGSFGLVLVAPFTAIISAWIFGKS